ncbi:single-stranded DNA-binding protein [Shewanella septentrionalis]|uniref:Single-stranded DNA-binding protein n=1 Tax=Shewanella septentrionalis TaxID=2952223 RepID=A0A9X2WYV2_9GAMM|nr:single-stranded DNA-binding protein [Shewanella septentrionalis]MCT7947699.1 single-stranded DNA-binding protein [Shewanella septentrionalis]
MFIKLCNIGQDAVPRYTPNGKAVTAISCAYSVGYGANKKTQWIEAELWGDRGETLAPKLTKGRRILLTADDVTIDTFPKADGTEGFKLKCRVMDIELLSKAEETSPAA